MVRVEDGLAEELKTTIEQKLIEADRGRELSDIQTLEEMRSRLTGLLRYANLALGTIYQLFGGRAPQTDWYAAGASVALIALSPALTGSASTHGWASEAS